MDPLDEYLLQHLTEYEDKKLQDASKDTLKIGGKESRAKTKELAKTFKKLTRWWKDLLNSENLESVKVIILQHNHGHGSWIRFSEKIILHCLRGYLLVVYKRKWAN